MDKGVWEILSDIDVALDILREASAAYALKRDTPMLIGVAPSERAHAASTARSKAMAAVAANPDDVSPVDEATVFAYVTSMESAHPMDVQWAVMTLLAIDTSFRHLVASNSPRRAADLVRDMPTRFERYLIGTDTTAAMTPHEAVCDFVCRVQFTYTGVVEQTAS